MTHSLFGSRQNYRVIVHDSGAIDESHCFVRVRFHLLVVAMATADQIMEVIQKSVATAVVKAMKQLHLPGTGAGTDDVGRSLGDGRMMRASSRGQRNFVAADFRIGSSELRWVLEEVAGASTSSWSGRRTRRCTATR